MFNSDTLPRLAAAKFGICVTPLQTDKFTDEQRRHLACKWIRRFLFPCLENPASIELLKWAEKADCQRSDPAEQRRVRLLSRQVLIPRNQNGGSGQFAMVASAYLVKQIATISCSKIEQVGNRIVNILSNRTHASQSNRKWIDCDNETRVDVYSKLADMSLRWSKSKGVDPNELRSLLDRKKTRRYYMPYFNPYAMRDHAVLNLPRGGDRTAFLKAIECFLRIASTHRISAASVRPLLAGTLTKIRYVREKCWALLAMAGKYHEEACEAMIERIETLPSPRRYEAVLVILGNKFPVQPYAITRLVDGCLESRSTPLR